MRSYLKSGSLTAIAITLAVAGAPPVHADEATFLREARELGFGISNVNIVSIGVSTCNFLNRNRDPDEIADRIQRYGQISQDAAHRFLVLAVGEYCPRYAARVGG